MEGRRVWNPQLVNANKAIAAEGRKRAWQNCVQLQLDLKRRDYGCYIMYIVYIL